MKKKKGWVRLSQEIKVRWVKDNQYIITDGRFTMCLTSQLWLEKELPGKIVVRERYYKPSDDPRKVIVRKDGGYPVLVNGKMVVRICSYDPTGKVRDYRINPNRFADLGMI